MNECMHTGLAAIVRDLMHDSVTLSPVRAHSRSHPGSHRARYRAAYLGRDEDCLVAVRSHTPNLHLPEADLARELIGHRFVRVRLDADRFCLRLRRDFGGLRLRLGFNMKTLCRSLGLCDDCVGFGVRLCLSKT
jgi:hypothetical protein